MFSNKWLYESFIAKYSKDEMKFDSAARQPIKQQYFIQNVVVQTSKKIKKQGSEPQHLVQKMSVQYVLNQSGLFNHTYVARFNRQPKASLFTPVSFAHLRLLSQSLAFTKGFELVHLWYVWFWHRQTEKYEQSSSMWRRGGWFEEA